MNTELEDTRQLFRRLHCRTDRDGGTVLAADLEYIPRANHARIAARAPERDVRVDQEHPCERPGTS